MHQISKRHLIAAMLSLAFAGAQAQAPSAKPLRIVVPFAAGSTTDVAARFIGQHITEKTQQPVIVENKPGANGFIGVQYLLSQQPDGQTFLITTSTTHSSNPALFKKLPYDAVTDFLPISGISVGGQVLAVGPSIKAESLKELVFLAKQQPGKITYGSSSTWTRAGAELFKGQAKVDLLHVPYKSMTNVVTDILGGRVDVTFGDSLSIMPHVRSGKLRALGITTGARMPGLENVPTVAEQGYPNYEMTGWIGAFAPKGTPVEAVDRLNELITTIVRSPEAARLFGESGWRPMPTTPQALAAFQKADLERWVGVVKSAGMEQE